MSRYILELKDVHKIYEVSREVKVHALKGVNLRVKEGEILIVMGPSGSGKSTLLNIIGTLDKPTSGRVIIDGVDITDLSERELVKFRLRKIGFVFQMYNLLSSLTSLENVMLPIIISGHLSESEAKSRAETLLNIVGLSDKLNARPIQLSGGQQQRVAIARALANDPAIVLADEPTGNIDVVSTVTILKLIKSINKFLGTTFIIVTHNPDVALIGSRIVNIRDGILYEHGKVPHITIDEAFDDIEMLELQLRFLKEELKSLSKMYRDGKIRKEEYLERISALDRRIKMIEKVVNIEA
ncbi:MAG: ABC transporter ATP-binding protein [Thermoprotei archaeon]|nr:MAG: ABC transporter ATP-binding protein [Thermoprotei archaeon]RLE88524.1 MAG: ABC transporter ATP-binding protein [Thermoprotei archaeon]